jgi:hypothetical protein
MFQLTTSEPYVHNFRKIRKERERSQGVKKRKIERANKKEREGWTKKRGRVREREKRHHNIN